MRQLTQRALTVSTTSRLRIFNICDKKLLRKNCAFDVKPSVTSACVEAVVVMECVARVRKIVTLIGS